MNCYARWKCTCINYKKSDVHNFVQIVRISNMHVLKVNPAQKATKVEIMCSHNVNTYDSEYVISFNLKYNYE